MHICLFGKPQAIEVLVMGPDGPDGLLERAFTDWAPLPEPLSLEPHEEMLRVSRHALGDTTYTWIGLYRHAYAIGSTRPGGFYGAALLFHRDRTPGDAAFRLLQSTAGNMQRLFLDPANADGAFLQKPTARVSDFDFPGIEAELDRRPMTEGHGLTSGAGNEIFIDLSDPPDRNRFGEFIDLAQTDPRFAADSAVYLSNSARVAKAARGARSTTRIVSYPPDLFMARPPAAVRAPVMRSRFHPGAQPPSRPPGGGGRDSPKLPINDIRYLIRDGLQEQLPGELERLLPALLKEHHKRLARRRRVEDVAVSAALLLLFLLAVLLGLKLMPRIDHPALVASTNAMATLDSDPSQRKQDDDRDAIERLLGDYVTAVAEGDGPGAVAEWARGKAPLSAARATARLKEKYQSYRIDTGPIAKLDGDDATASLGVAGTLKDNTTFTATANVNLRRDNGDWKIESMDFGDNEAANPDLQTTAPVAPLMTSERR